MLGIANVIFLAPSVVGGLKGIWEAVERYRHFMHRRDGGDLPTHEAAHREMGHAGIFAAVESYRHFMQDRDGGDLPTFEAAHREMGHAGLFEAVERYRHFMHGRDGGDLPTFEAAHRAMSCAGLFEAVERYRHFMHGRDGGDLPTHEAAHSELGHAGLFEAVENYRHFMHGRDGGDLPTHEAAHRAMSHEGFLNRVEDTRIALEEHVSGEVTNKSALSVDMAICGHGNSGKPKSELCFHPSTIIMIEQYANQEFSTPVSDSRGRINKVFSTLNEDTCYALYLWGVVKSTFVAINKMASWIEQANANDGSVKYADIPVQSRRHNHGEVYYVRLTVLSEEPLDVRPAPKRPPSDKRKSQNKVIVHEDGGGDGDGGLTISFEQVPLIKTARKVLKDANTKEKKKESDWIEYKTNAATYKKRTEAEAKDANTNTEKKKKKKKMR
jgi:hypothetical protein